jgi:2-polyprenyl-6-methoxyphenol hydroxylase-like FAD-dependent oxidoreductase
MPLASGPNSGTSPIAPRDRNNWRFSSTGVVLIGDAAHTTTPHLASGAGIAIEDAIVLAEELASDQSVHGTPLRALPDGRRKLRAPG